ncbi:MAG: branched-chain amino acid transport system substrate-binding protein [Baekduia sp.]|nr:branched-chain amino acid transport system substrate-binding protein [Baekduia sp.]
MARRRTAVLASMLLAVAGGISACGGSESGSAATGSAGSSTTDKGPIKIGVASGQTGLVSFFDGPALAGAKVAVKDINAKGGVAGRQLELVVADHKSDPNQIAPAALKVIEQGAKIVLGSCDYDFAGPAARTAQAKGLLTLACAGSPVFGRQGIGPLAFNAYVATPAEGATMAEFAMQKGWTKAYALKDMGLEYSKTTCQYFTEAYKKLGGTIVGSDTFKNDDPSVQSQITKLKGSGAQFVSLCSYPPGGAAAVKQIRDSGVKLPIVGGGAFDGTYWLKGIPKLSDFYNPGQGTVADEQDPARKAFWAEYKQVTGAEALTGTYPLMGYSMIQIVAKALEATNGNTDGKALAAAIEKFKDVQLLPGLTTYTAKCHVPLSRALLINQIQNGKQTFVETLKPKFVPASPC